MNALPSHPPQAMLAVWVFSPIHALADRMAYSKIRAGLGVQKAVVSGGGALPPHTDDWCGDGAGRDLLPALPAFSRRCPLIQMVETLTSCALAVLLKSRYEAIGMTVLNGYGLTETSPVLACRRTYCNIRGTVGLPLPGASQSRGDRVGNWNAPSLGRGSVAIQPQADRAQSAFAPARQPQAERNHQRQFR